MPKTFELKFNKIAENLYAGSLLVEGRQMAFGVPKTKEEIYHFLFAAASSSAPALSDMGPAIQQRSSVQQENVKAESISSLPPEEIH